MAVGNPTNHSGSGPNIPFWRDLRFWQVLLQIVFLVIVIIVAFNLGNNIVTALAENNQSPNFRFLGDRAGFDIGGASNYTADDSFFEAFVVGVRNTLSVVTVGLVTTTILGIFFGIFLLSNNWLLRTLSRIYVEILRNTPLLVQLVLWYFVVFAALPRPQEAIEFPGSSVIDLPWRWVIYFAGGLFIAFYFQDRSRNVRSGTVIGGLAAASIIEIGFWQIRQLQIQGTEASIAMADLLRSGNSGNAMFIAYVIISAVLIGVVWFLVKHESTRAALLGLFIGQFVGGLLFYFGIIPGGFALRTEGVMLSMSARGVYLPQFVTTPRYPMWLSFVTLGVIIALAQWFYLGQITENTGRQFPRAFYAVGAIVVLAFIGWFLVRLGAPPVTTDYLDQSNTVVINEGTVEITVEEGVTIFKDRKGTVINVLADGETRTLSIYEGLRERVITPRHISALDKNALSFFPVVRDDSGRRYVAGTGLSPEYMAVLVGLVIYTSAFIAEIVRAGIQAVPKGQQEAAGALGLNANDTLSMIILPQALRVIIPPLGNQYLNLAKNSSLAVVASYSDIYNVMNTIINQSGQSVSGIIIIMVSYLIISLTISFVMNLINQRFQLVTR